MVDFRRKGIIFVVMGLAFLTVSDSIVRWLAPFYPLHEITFLRGLFSIPSILLAAFFLGAFGTIRFRAPGILVLRAFLMANATACLLLSLAVLPYANAIGLFFISPVLITTLSAILLRERVGPRLWSANAVGLLGVVVMFRPFGDETDLRSLLPLGAALSYASVQVLNRHSREVHSGALMVLSAHIGILFVSAIAGLVLWKGASWDGESILLEFLLRAWRIPGAGHILLIAVCGMIASLGAFFIFQSYRLVKAPLIAPFEYSAVLFATLSGYLVWSEIPGLAAIAGMTLIAGAGLIAMSYERSGRSTQ